MMAASFKDQDDLAVANHSYLLLEQDQPMWFSLPGPS
jgi:hypothetical protein